MYAQSERLSALPGVLGVQLALALSDSRQVLLVHVVPGIRGDTRSAVEAASVACGNAVCVSELPISEDHGEHATALLTPCASVDYAGVVAAIASIQADLMTSHTNVVAIVPGAERGLPCVVIAVHGIGYCAQGEALFPRRVDHAGTAFQVHVIDARAWCTGYDAYGREPAIRSELLVGGCAISAAEATTYGSIGAMFRINGVVYGFSAAHVFKTVGQVAVQPSATRDAVYIGDVSHYGMRRVAGGLEGHDVCAFVPLADAVRAGHILDYGVVSAERRSPVERVPVGHVRSRIHDGTLAWSGVPVTSLEPDVRLYMTGATSGASAGFATPLVKGAKVRATHIGRFVGAATDGPRAPGNHVLHDLILVRGDLGDQFSRPGDSGALVYGIFDGWLQPVGIISVTLNMGGALLSGATLLHAAIPALFRT